MEQIASDGHRVFYLGVLAPGDGVDPPFGGDPYPALVWATSGTTAAQKARLCAALIESGCRYLMCGGRESAVWEEVADEVATAPDRTGVDGDAAEVMTASYERRPPDEVVFDFVYITDFPPHRFARYLVLMVGENSAVRDELIASIQEEMM
jgi:hypothetical protein